MNNWARVPTPEDDKIDYSQILHDIRIQFHTLSSALQVMKRCTGEGPIFIGDTDITYFHDVMCDAVQKGIAMLGEALPTRAQTEENPFSLVSLLRGILDGISLLAENYGFSLIYSSLDECILPGSKSKAERVLYNIITNALTHTPSNTVVSIEMSREREGFVCVSISDQGDGLTEQQGQILTGPYPFPEGTEQMYGLRSVRKLMDELGGHITVEKLMPIGMRISIYFSCVKA